MIAGLLVDGLDDLDVDHDLHATSDDQSWRASLSTTDNFGLPVPGHRTEAPLRRTRRNGRVLRNANFACLPFREQLAAANPIGPLATFPGDDTGTPEPFGEGVVLIGDTTGYNSPIIGQGLSIALRDARLVRNAIRAAGSSVPDFQACGIERLERMRRLREAAMFMAWGWLPTTATMGVQDRLPACDW